MMKTQKRILAWMMAILLLLPLVGCSPANNTGITASSGEDGTESDDIIMTPDDSSDDETEEDDSPEENPAQFLESFSTGSFNGKAVAIELGEIRATADEVWYKRLVTIDESELEHADRELSAEYMQSCEEMLVYSMMYEWKAAAFGITLSEELLEEFDADTRADVEEYRDALLCQYGDPEGSVEDVSELTEEQYADALNSINAKCAEQFGDGYTLDDYLALLYKDTFSKKRIDALSALLEEYCARNTPVDQAAVDAWYEETLDEQRDLFANDPEQYINCANGYDYADYGICLYVPAESARIQVIFIPSEESDSSWLEGNEAWIAELESEYEELKESGEDDDYLPEIEFEIAELKKENAVLEARLAAGEEATANAVYADLVDGMSFEDAMAAYENYDDEESGHFERIVLLDGNEPDFPMFVETAKALSPGTFSQPVRIDDLDQYCIIRLVEIIPEGVVDRASIEDKLRPTIIGDAWPLQQDTWFEEAMNAAVFHRETYEMLFSAVN